MPIEQNTDVAAIASANRVPDAVLDSIIAASSVHYFTAWDGLIGAALPSSVDTGLTLDQAEGASRVTICMILLPKDSFIPIGHSMPQRAASFDAERGRRQALQRARKCLGTYLLSEMAAATGSGLLSEEILARAEIEEATNLLRQLPLDDRVDVLDRFCQHCGAEDPNCRCQDY